MSTETQTQDSLIFDERAFNERFRQLFNSIDATSYSLPNNIINERTSIHATIFPEQISLDHQHQSDTEQCLSTNDLRPTTSKRFSCWKNQSSASSFCGDTIDESKVTHSSSITTHHHHHRRSSSRPRPYFTPSSKSLSIAAAPVTISNKDNTTGRPRSLSELVTNNISNTTSIIDYRSCFTNRLSTTPAGSHEKIAGNTNTIAPFTSSDVLYQSSSIFTVLYRPT